MPLSAALAAMDPALPFIDDWQRAELCRCGLNSRQIPRDTIHVLRRLQGLGSVSALKAASLEAMLERVALGSTHCEDGGYGGVHESRPAAEAPVALAQPRAQGSSPSPKLTPGMQPTPVSMALGELRVDAAGVGEGRTNEGRTNEKGTEESASPSFLLPLMHRSPVRSPPLAPWQDATHYSIDDGADNTSQVLNNSERRQHGSGGGSNGGGGGKHCWEQSAEWEKAMAEVGLHGLSYQPGFPKRFSVQVLSYNLNVLPHGARFFGGPSHDYPQERLQAFVTRPELEDFEVLLLQEIFATPLLRTLLCRQRWLRQQLALRGFVHQVVSPLHAGVSITFRKGAGWSWTDSGLLIVSKLPVVSSGFERYQRGLHLDAGATKGILYAKLQVGSRQIFVFNTHLQASHSGAGGNSYCKLRALQLSQLRRCVSEVMTA